MKFSRKPESKTEAADAAVRRKSTTTRCRSAEDRKSSTPLSRNWTETEFSTRGCIPSDAETKKEIGGGEEEEEEEEEEDVDKVPRRK